MARFKRTASEMQSRAINSLVLSIEIFNRPFEAGRKEAVLILLHHSFEMLLKAIIFQKTDKLHVKGSKYTYSFDKCLDVCQNELNVVSQHQRATLSILDAHRDNAVHYFQDISEDMLYVQAQASVTLFDILLSRNFFKRLADYMPSRVLPVSTKPPKDLQLLLDSELERVDELLCLGERKKVQAVARLRPILSLVTAIRDGEGKISDNNIKKAITRRKRGEQWRVIFPEITQISLEAEGEGLGIAFKIDKHAELAVKIAAPDEEVVGTVIKQEIDPWDKYNLSFTDMAEKLILSRPKALALVEELEIKNDKELYKVLRRQSQTFQGYSKKALDKCREYLKNNLIEDVWERKRERIRTYKKEIRQ